MLCSPRWLSFQAWGSPTPLRALGPTLAQFGITDPLQDPTIELRAGNGSLLSSNDNWKDTQQAEIQATGFATPDDKESAIIIERPPARATAIVRGKNNTTGNALSKSTSSPTRRPDWKGRWNKDRIVQDYRGAVPETNPVNPAWLARFCSPKSVLICGAQKSFARLAQW